MSLHTLLGATDTGNWLNLVILAVIGGSAVLGLFRGLIQSLAGVGGLILGALFAGRLAVLLDPALDHANIKHPPITGGAAFVVAFLVIVIAVEIAAGFLRIVSKVLFLGWVDRLGGAAFGAVRGILLSMILLAGLTQLGTSGINNSIKQAQVAVYMWQNMNALTAMLPDGMRQSTIRLVAKQIPFLGQPGTP